jgi:hypothetical protein
LELRAYPFSVKRPGNVTRIKSEVFRLIDIANHKIKRDLHRTKRKNSYTEEDATPTQTDSTTTPIDELISTTTTTPPDIFEPIESTTIVPTLSPTTSPTAITSNVLGDEMPSLIEENNQPKRHRKTSCMCEVISTNTENAIFICVPPVRKEIPIEKRNSNRARRFFL